MPSEPRAIGAGWKTLDAAATNPMTARTARSCRNDVQAFTSQPSHMSATLKSARSHLCKRRTSANVPRRQRVGAPARSRERLCHNRAGCTPGRLTRGRQGRSAAPSELAVIQVCTELAVIEGSWAAPIIMGCDDHPHIRGTEIRRLGHHGRTECQGRECGNDCSKSERELEHLYPHQKGGAGYPPVINVNPIHLPEMTAK